MGKKIEVDEGRRRQSDWPTFATKAEKLLTQDKVATVFGGWTSASRKAMLPVFEKNKGLLFYPVQFEGNECSPNIIYTGAQPNQQALPALEWALSKGYKNIFLLGSDYVYPRTANLILKKHITAMKATLAGEEYVALGGTEFSSVINKIKAAKPQIIIKYPQRRQQRVVLQAVPGGGLQRQDPAGHQLLHRRAGGPEHRPGPAERPVRHLELLPEPAQRRQQEVRGRLPEEVRSQRRHHRSDGARLHGRVPVEGRRGEGQVVRTRRQSGRPSWA